MASVLETALMLSGLWINAQSWDMPEKLDYRNHDCHRDCLREPIPRTCEYTFTIEHYMTLSYACFNCPRNLSDCFRPHCVAGDGRRRAIKVVNRQMPGPAINVCQGDTVKVNVYNQLGDSEGTSIHWHGILQEGSPHMDGVAMITQCPIPAYSKFQYKFRADNPGTHYWHGHAGFHRGDGVFGALIVRDYQTTQVMSLYDHDFPEHTLIVQDWLDQSTASKFSLHHHGMDDNEPSSVLINGRGSSCEVGMHMMHDSSMEMSNGAHSMGMDSKATHEPSDSTDQMEMPNCKHNMDKDSVTMHESMDNTTMHEPVDNMTMHESMDNTTTHEPMDNMTMHEPMDNMTMHETMDNMTMGGPNCTTDKTEMGSYIPRNIFRVTKGKRYRFRLISNGIMNCPLKVSVENHTLTVIASDGYDMNPVVVDSITMYAGERYDFVLSADQMVGNYWMHVAGLGDCARKQTYETAVLRYEGAMDTAPSSRSSYAVGVKDGKDLNPLTVTPESLTSADMKSPEYPADLYLHTSDTVKRFYLAMDFNKVGNPTFLHPVLYSLDEVTAGMIEMGMDEGSTHVNHLFSLQMNHITNAEPPAPPLTQYNDLDEAMFCNETSATTDCKTEFCKCVHRIKVQQHDIVELVLVSEAQHGAGHHPMHLHGHNFYVLGIGKLNASTTRHEVEMLDVKGKLHRNLQNPIKKDTVAVPDGGYAIIRFTASNLGFWLFHCHVEFHMSLGLSLVLQVGEVHEMPKFPAKFPRCGNWDFTDDTSDYGLYSNSAYRLHNFIGNWLISLTIVEVLCYFFIVSN